MTWTWSIQASGTKDDVLTNLQALTCPTIDVLADDGTLVPTKQSDETIALFEKNRADAITAVQGWPTGVTGSVSVSGNDTRAIPTIQQYKPKSSGADITALDEDTIAKIKAAIAAGKL